MTHDARCTGTHWKTHAHPDGRTLLTFCYKKAPLGVANYDASAQRVGAQLWDARALSQARATIALDRSCYFLGFVRDVLRIMKGTRIAHFDLHTGRTLGMPYEFEHGPYWYVSCANEALVGIIRWTEGRRSVQVCAFAGT